MKETVLLILFCTPLLCLISFVVIALIKRFNYNRKYVNKDGWKLCCECKKCEDPVYYTDTWFLRKYKCGDCAFK